MFRWLILLATIITLHSCTLPNEVKIPETSKAADSLTRHCMNLLASGNLAGVKPLLDTATISDTAFIMLNQVSQELSRSKIKKGRSIEWKVTTNHLTPGAKHTHRLVYEYELEDRSILLTSVISEMDNHIMISGLHWNYLLAPLEKLTAFSFAGKPTVNYIFLLIAVIVSAFIVVSFIVMLKIPMSAGKKWKWAAIILLLSISRFSLNWNTSETHFKLLDIRLISTIFSKPNLYSPWILQFSIPVGALLFWLNRRRLMTDAATEKLSTGFIETIGKTED